MSSHNKFNEISFPIEQTIYSFILINAFYSFVMDWKRVIDKKNKPVNIDAMH